MNVHIIGRLDRRDCILDTATRSFSDFAFVSTFFERQNYSPWQVWEGIGCNIECDKVLRWSSPSLAWPLFISDCSFSTPESPRYCLPPFVFCWSVFRCAHEGCHGWVVVLVYVVAREGVAEGLRLSLAAMAWLQWPARYSWQAAGGWAGRTIY